MEQLFTFGTWRWAMLGVLGLAACQPELAPEPAYLRLSALDRQLDSVLSPSAGGLGRSGYRLPEAGDYLRIPQDPQNPLTRSKVELGKLLFHEPAMGIVPKDPAQRHTYSCASCHLFQLGFQAGRRQGIGEGGQGFGSLGEGRKSLPGFPAHLIDVQQIRAPSVLHVAYQENMLWNGQFGAGGANVGTEDRWLATNPTVHNHLGLSGIETQAIAGLETHRLAVDAYLLDTLGYRAWFDEAFFNQPEAARGTDFNAAMAIAAYERTLLADQAPWQRWLRGEETAMTDRQKEGALLFFGKAGCDACHTGPALNSNSFHALGMEDLTGPGILGVPNDKIALGRGDFAGDESLNFAFKTPQLYNLRGVDALGHGGTFSSVREVIAYKNAAIPQKTTLEARQLSPQFQPLGLTEAEIFAITAFIEDALYDPNLDRYVPSSLPSGFCFPNNDPVSRQDLGCE